MKTIRRAPVVKVSTSQILLVFASALCAILHGPASVYGQETLVNGHDHYGTVALQGTNLYTLNASAGDAIVLRVGTTNFNPRLTVFTPGGELLGTEGLGSVGVRDISLMLSAPSTGDYRVEMSSFYENGTGNYNLRLLKVPGALTVPSHDEGGALANGSTVGGRIDLGDLDGWTFQAQAGDSIVVRMGGSGFNPRLDLFGPGGALAGSAGVGSVGARDARLSLVAEQSGEFTVVASSFLRNGVGDYIVSLVRAPGELFVSEGDEGGDIANGTANPGMLPVGDLDAWNFSAQAGDRILLRMGGVGLNPRLDLFGPDGVLVSSAGVGSVNYRDAMMEVTATNSGTYVVVASTFVLSQSGEYTLHLATIPGAFEITEGDDGGALTNGWAQAGEVSVGDMDMWSFHAEPGEALILRMGGVGLNPWIRLYGPGGEMVGAAGVGSVNYRDAELEVTAAASGTYVAVASTFNLNQSGDYTLHLAKVPGTIYLTPGDEGGFMTNGVGHLGELPVGDLDMWSFHADAGDALVLRMGGVGLNPWIRLYGPDGGLMGSAGVGSVNYRDTELEATAAASGTHVVVAGAFVRNQSGSYTLHSARVPGMALYYPGDEGGELANGAATPGNLEVGDQDVWMFEATQGDTLILRTGTVGLNPWLRLYGPDGQKIGESGLGGVGVRDAALESVAEEPGNYTVIMSAFNLNQSGSYTLNLARVPAAFEVSPGDEGGSLPNGVSLFATNALGDLDLWRFQVCRADVLRLSLEKLTGNSLQALRMRLFGPDGAVVAMAQDRSVATIQHMAAQSGGYMLVVDGVSLGTVADYRLEGAGITMDGERLCWPVIEEQNYNLAGLGWTPGETFVLYTAPDLLPPIDWSPLLTNQFDPWGAFDLTTPREEGETQRYFYLESP